MLFSEGTKQASIWFDFSSEFYRLTASTAQGSHECVSSAGHWPCQLLPFGGSNPVELTGEELSELC